MESVDALVGQIDEPNRSACAHILADHRALLATVPGAAHNHQAWCGGYLDHVCEVMNIARVLHDQFSALRPLPFSPSDLLLVDVRRRGARLWFDHPASADDPWIGATRAAPQG